MIEKVILKSKTHHGIFEERSDEHVDFHILKERIVPQLSDNQKVVLALLEMGLTKSEVAEEMSITPQAVDQTFKVIRQTAIRAFGGEYYDRKR